MANRKLGVSLLLTTALAGTGYGVLQDSTVEQLETKVKALEARVSAVETYTRAQARSLQAFGASLDVAVQKGFTAGANFESRQILVRGWREIVDAAAKNPLKQAAPTVESKPVYARPER